MLGQHKSRAILSIILFMCLTVIGAPTYAESGEVKGKITIDDSEQGISNIPLDLCRVDDETQLLKRLKGSTTDSTGAFYFAGLKPGNYEIRQGAGCFQFFAEGTPYHGFFLPKSLGIFEILSDESIQLDHKATQGASIYGRIIDTQGHALKSLIVCAETNLAEALSRSTPKGEFRIDAINPSSDCSLRVKPSAYSFSINMTISKQKLVAGKAVNVGDLVVPALTGEPNLVVELTDDPSKPWTNRGPFTEMDFVQFRSADGKFEGVSVAKNGVVRVELPHGEFVLSNQDPKAVGSRHPYYKPIHEALRIRSGEVMRVRFDLKARENPSPLIGKASPKAETDEAENVHEPRHDIQHPSDPSPMQESGEQP